MCLNIWRCCVHICVCSNNFHLFTVILHWNHTYTLYSANGFECGPRKPYSYQNHLTEWIVGRTKKTVSFCSRFVHFFFVFCLHSFVRPPPPPSTPFKSYSTPNVRQCTWDQWFCCWFLFSVILIFGLPFCCCLFSLSFSVMFSNIL